MKLYKLLFLIPLLLLSACDLDREPTGISNFWQSEADAWMGLNAAYQPFYEEEGYGRGHWWAGALSDDMVYNMKRNNEDPIATFTAELNNSGGMYENWQLMYRVIRRSNDALEHVPNIEMSDQSRNIMLGEANFLCAFSYFFLAKRYGGLPFYDYKTPEITNKPRETLTETYDRIEDYLKESIRLFEAQNLWIRDKKDLGRPHLGAAYGLLAKVYAYRGKYAESKAASEKVIGKYSLNTTANNGYANLFSLDGEKHEEVLFNLTNMPVRNQGSITSTVPLSKKFTGGQGWMYFAPTQSLLKAHETGDLRREVTMKKEGDIVKYPGYIAILQSEENALAAKENRPPLTITAPIAIDSVHMSDMTTGLMCTKYAAAYEAMPTFTWHSGADVPLLRYADVLLLHAEAEIFLAGGGSDNRTQGVAAAANSFNQVRVRAFGNDASKAIASPTFNDLVKERRCELAYEDERHFDLVRWGLAKEIYEAGLDDPRGQRTFDPVNNRYMPLPQKEINNSDGLLINNPAPGYSTFE